MPYLHNSRKSKACKGLNDLFFNIPTYDTKEHAVNMLRIYDYIERHICEELKLEKLAGIMALTPNCFSHLFKNNRDYRLRLYKRQANRKGDKNFYLRKQQADHARNCTNLRL